MKTGSGIHKFSFRVDHVHETSCFALGVASFTSILDRVEGWVCHHRVGGRYHCNDMTGLTVDNYVECSHDSLPQGFQFGSGSIITFVLDLPKIISVDGDRLCRAKLYIKHKPQESAASSASNEGTNNTQHGSDNKFHMLFPNLLNPRLRRLSKQEETNCDEETSSSALSLVPFLILTPESPLGPTWAAPNNYDSITFLGFETVKSLEDEGIYFPKITFAKQQVEGHQQQQPSSSPASKANEASMEEEEATVEEEDGMEPNAKKARHE